MSTPIEYETYGVAGTTPLRDITNIPYILFQKYIKNHWNNTLAYGIEFDDVEFGTTPDENNTKDILVKVDPLDTSINENMDIYEKFSEEDHFMDVQMFVKADALLDNNEIPPTLVDLIRYLKMVIKTSKTKVVDIENCVIVGQAPIERDPLSEWYGWKITIALVCYMVTTEW